MTKGNGKSKFTAIIVALIMLIALWPGGMLLADEDSTPPEWYEGFPKAGSISDKEFNLQVRGTVAGTVYYVRLPDGATPAPSAEQVAEGKDGIDNQLYYPEAGSVGVGTGGSSGTRVKGLTPYTSYDVYTVLEDSAGNLQVEPTLVEVTTTVPSDANSGITQADPGVPGYKKVMVYVTVKNSAGVGSRGYFASDFSVKVDGNTKTFADSPFSNFNDYDNSDGLYSVVFTGETDNTEYTLADLTVAGVVIEAGSYKIKTPNTPPPALAAPTGLVWDSTTPGKATWDMVSNASSYELRLYKGGSLQGDPVNVPSGTEHDFTSAITEAGDGSYTFTVTAIGDGNNYGNSQMSAESEAYDYTATGADTVINIPAIAGVTAPATGAAPVTAITDTAQYTGTVSWSPAIVDNKFAAETQYTATITLTPKSGYILTGVTENFFTVAGATPVTNAADSGVVTAVFPATGSLATYVCEVSTTPTATKYTSLDDALAVVEDGQTITLLADIIHNDGIEIEDKSVALNLNGRTLNVTNTLGPGLIVTNGAVTLMGDSGSFNVSGSSFGVQADNSIVTVTNATATGPEGRGVWASGSTININGSVTSNFKGAEAVSGGIVNITGNCNGNSAGAHASGTGSAITINGDASSTETDGFGVMADSGAIVTVNDATAAGANSSGAKAIAVGTVTINGRAQGTAYGVYAYNYATITAKGDVSATGDSGAAAFATSNSIVTIDGTVSGDPFIQVGGTRKGPNEFTTDPTKPGYCKYTNDGVSIVWVKDPTAIPNVHIAAGGGFSLFLEEDGTPWSWGGNMYGQLGNGTDGQYTAKDTPQRIPGLSGIVQLQAGHLYSLALKDDGTVWVWGTNGNGQLCQDSSVSLSNVPVQVSGLTNITAISAGDRHALAIKNDGTVWGWGSNGYGQLGNGATIEAQRSLVQVSGLTGVEAVTAGYEHSMALKSDGTVWVWGNNASGQLGNGTTTNSSIPLQVSSLSQVDKVYSAGFNSAAIIDGDVWAWGGWGDGQLGPDATETSFKTPQKLAGLSDMRNLGGAGSFFIALKEDGTVWSWGRNDFGQLGIGTTGVKVPTPTQIAGLSDIIVISDGTNCDHSLAVEEDGTVWAWGYNSNGQLGNDTSGTDTNSKVPVRVQFAGGADITPPDFADTYPKQGEEQAAGSRWVRLEVKPQDETVTAYYVVLADGADAPTAEQVMAGKDSSDAYAIPAGMTTGIMPGDDGGVSFSIRPLPNHNADYDAYVVIKDASGNTTLAGPVNLITPGPAEIFSPDYPVQGAAQAVGSKKVQINVKSGIDAKVYYVVVPNGAATPAINQVRGGKDSSNGEPLDEGDIDLTADTEGSFITAALPADNTAYDIYLVARKTVDGDYFYSAVVKLDVVTPAAPSSGSPSGGGGGSTPGTTIDSDGGTVKDDGAKVVFPKDAVDTSIRVSIARKGSSGLTIPEGYRLVSSVFDITKNKSGNFKKDVTVTLPFDQGKADAEEDELAVYCWNGSRWDILDNNKVDWSGANASGTIDHLGKFAVLAKAKTDTVPVEPDEPETPEVTLNDITGHWAEEAIRSLVAAGAITGYSDGSFQPNRTVTRAEFAHILVQAMDIPAVENGKVFADTANHWAQTSIAKAYAAGIITGYGDDKFGPNDLVTREQIAAMVVRAAKLTGPEGQLNFADSGEISHWAREDVSIASGNGLITGYGDNTFRPGNNATRAEAAIIIYRAVK